MTGLPIDDDREIAEEGFRVGHKRRVRPPLGVFPPRADPVLYQSFRYWSSKEPYSNSGHKNKENLEPDGSYVGRNIEGVGWGDLRCICRDSPGVLL